MRTRARRAATWVLTASSLALAAATSLPADWQDDARASSSAPQAVAFVDVSVVPMDQERVLEGQTVVVRAGRIVELGPAANTAVPEGAERVDGRGKFLLPGLADMHVHLHSDDEQVNRAVLQLFLANGVTTILNLKGSPHHLDLRARIEAGALSGPTLYTSGPFVSNAPEAPPSVAEVEQAVVEQKRAGYDFIKIHGEFSREAYRKLFEVARREKIRVIGHAPRSLGIEVVFEERQHAIAHAEEYIYAYFKSLPEADRESKIPSIAEATARAGVWVIPNLTAYRGIWLQAKDISAVLDRPEMKYVPKGFAEEWQPDRNTYVQRFRDPESVQRLERNYRLLESLVKGFGNAGVRMLAGTDALIPSVVPGFSLHDELADLVAAGLTPYEAVATATVHPAEFLGVSQQTGTVAVGKRADLILLDGNPLEDVRNTRKLAGVMVGGRWLDPAALRQALEGLVAK